MASKMFRVKVNKENDIEQVIVKMGTQQCGVIKFNNNDEMVVYLNNYATEMSAGFYIQHFNQLIENSDKIKRVIGLMAHQSSERKKRLRERMGGNEKVDLMDMEEQEEDTQDAEMFTAEPSSTSDGPIPSTSSEGSHTQKRRRIIVDDDEEDDDDQIPVPFKIRKIEE